LTHDIQQADLFVFPYYLENLTEWATISGMYDFITQLSLFQPA